MAAMFQPWILFLLFFSSILHFSSSQTNPNPNLETFFPSGTTPPLNTPPLPPPNTTPSTITSQTPSSPSSSSNNKIAEAVLATAFTTLFIAGVFFFLLHKYIIAPRYNIDQRTLTISNPDTAFFNEESKSFDGTLKGLIVDENGLDMLYWRKLEGGQLRTSFRKEVFAKLSDHAEPRRGRVTSKRERQTRSEAVQEIPLLRGKSSSSSAQTRPDFVDANSSFGHSSSRTIEIVRESIKTSTPITPPKPLLLSAAVAAPPPPPPPPPPLPSMIPVKKVAAPPPTSPIPIKKNSAPPPPPPVQLGGLSASSRPPIGPKMKSIGGSRRGEPSSSESLNAMANGQAKLKPLHWDKVSAKADHSMVWDKVNDGSFRFDDDLMEALFGYVATNRKSPDVNRKSNLGNQNSGEPAQIFILDPRKSQNIAIVLKSLTVSRQEILDGLLEGQGLNSDSLEKLSRIAPTKEEESQLLEFDGNPMKLADAESFLYHILKAVPSPFARVNAMLFRTNYDPEILHLKESLQTLELGCKELRTHGLFFKLLEAVLKAGNRMNAGTARGNAQAFNLSALRKLSDVKSTDGKTTLLHFVVEEVVRSEGKRGVLNRNYSLNRSNSRGNSNNSLATSDNTKLKEDQEKEYMMLGLPVVGGLSAEFSNVKKAATIDYETFVNSCNALTARVNEIRDLLAQINASKGSGFVREMKGVIESAEEELTVVKEEQARVMELVRRTTEYYQAGASKDKNPQPLQLFVIVKDFLSMVDKVCVDVARNLQKKKVVKPSSSGSSSPPSPARAVRFPYLPAHFLSDKSRTSSSSDSEEGF